MLLEDFADSLDLINDNFTDMTEGEFHGNESIASLLADADKVLAEHGLKLDYNDVELLMQDWDEPGEFEANNVLMPLYDMQNGDTAYNLSLTYASAEPGTRLYMVDLEVQYEWEADDEIETVYVGLDD